MLKFKKISIILVFYFIIMLLYFYFLRVESISIDFFYVNSIFIIIYLVIANLFIEPNKLLNFKLYRYNNKKNFFKDCIKLFSLNTFVIYLCISIINSILVALRGFTFNFLASIYYFFNIFIIIEIAYAYILSFSLKKNITILRYLVFITLIAMFYFGTYDTGITPVNIFKYVYYSGTWYQIIIHYAIWILSAYLLFDFNSKRVEI